MVKSLKKENRALKGKEKKLVSLILALKDNGYPVEEVYDNMLQGK